VWGPTARLQNRETLRSIEGGDRRYVVLVLVDLSRELRDSITIASLTHSTSSNDFLISTARNLADALG